MTNTDKLETAAQSQNVRMVESEAEFLAEAAKRLTPKNLRNMAAAAPEAIANLELTPVEATV